MGGSDGSGDGRARADGAGGAGAGGAGASGEGRGGPGARRSHAETARLLWGSPRTRGRGPRPGLDLGDIARAGIDVAGAEGLAAVSMQRVAAGLGVTKMALYRYVPGKSELVALMVDAAIGPYPEGGGPCGGWRAQLTAWAQELIAVFQRHPWVLDGTVGARPIGPSELSWMERPVAALGGTPLSGAERLDAAVLLVGHARSISEQARASTPGASQEGELSTVLTELIQAQGDRCPALAAALGSAAERREEMDQAWEFGLERILDGLAVLIERREGRDRERSGRERSGSEG
ncbi:TetR/AcrR family transcriptional regulator [Streptomyces sp. HNM0575]|uniref:TetR/AcrR family transcriptional regulator n=1 Tax=Streptomyces sp. HNM0575 TaxID=2716338 RepID=UPI00145DA4AF|nr:TetR/AcrR family transcriptional regulator [Streptomyces sp. HNM0575]NLU71503.1 TetR/AcrR family transcriptional regulator [Streptomyces sp. HNM0575]